MPSNRIERIGDAARRFFQTTRPNNTVARIVDTTIQTCIDRPTASSKWTDRIARNPRSTQWCVVGITNKANKKKFAYRIALTIAREHIAGDAASMMGPRPSIASRRVCQSTVPNRRLHSNFDFFRVGSYSQDFFWWVVKIYFLPKTSFSSAVVWAAGFLRIFFSSSPSS